MASAATIARVREFNRSWTEILGLLDRSLLHTEHTLAEARVLFELARQSIWERSALQERLGIDPSFLSRVLRRLENDGLVVSTPSAEDGRALDITITDRGHEAYEILDQRSSDQIEALLRPLTPDQTAFLTEAMTVISRLVGRGGSKGEVTLRGLEPGDLGWVVERHGAIYADEYGWNTEFEALVARIVAGFRENLSPERENAWIAELDGARAGCVFCCQRDQDTAQLRILLVEPWARGHGIGSQLVAACIDFARGVGYSKMVLWTNDVLVSARKIYEAAGFSLIEEEEHHSFGHDLLGQTWELDLVEPA